MASDPMLLGSFAPQALEVQFDYILTDSSEGHSLTRVT